MTACEQAYQLYEARKRGESPVGVWFRTGGWDDFSEYRIPDHERHECCEGLGRLDQHVKTTVHVAHVFGLDPKEFRRYVLNRRISETKRKRRQHA